MATDRYMDLLKQGFMKQGRQRVRKAPKQPPPIIACEDCMNWHRKGKHTADKETRDRRKREMRAKAKPVESHIFPGMETAVEEQTAAAGEYVAEELTAKMLEPLGDVSRKAGQMETHSPLFYGQVHPTLFSGGNDQ